MDDLIIKAARENNSEYIYQLFADEQSARQIKEDELHDDALVEAAERGAYEAAVALLENGASVNSCRDEAEQTALMVAVQKNKVEIINLLMSCGAGVNVTDANGNTALTYCAESDAADVATQLIYWRADVNHINQDQVTPLLRAIQTDHLKIFEVLLKENAGIPAKPSDVQHDAISSARAVLLKSCEKYNATKIKMYLQSLGPEESRNAWVVPGSQSAQPTSARQVVQPTLASHSAKPMTAKKGVVLDPTMLGEHLIQIKKNIVGWDSNPGYSNDANTPGSSAGASMSGFSADASKTGFSADASKTGFSADASKTGFSTAASKTGCSTDASKTGSSTDASKR